MSSLSDLYSYAPSEVMAMLFPQTSAYRPDLPKASTQSYNRVNDFGPRWNEQTQSAPMTALKGYGWLGPMLNKSGNVMSEYSMTDENGNTFPSFVPTLNAQEVQYLMYANGLPSIPTQARAFDDSIYNKAKSFAGLRRMQGLSPFYD